MARPKKIISGLQTGGDQGGLFAAEELGIETGGHCPKNGRTEDGDRPDLVSRFKMTETLSASYPERTIKNVFNSTGTVWFGTDTSPGFKLTHSTAVRLSRPFLKNPSPVILEEWVHSNKIEVMNVAGNRESTNKGIFASTKKTIVEAFKETKNG